MTSGLGNPTHDGFVSLAVKNIISFQVGGEALAAPAGPERHSVGTGDDGEEPEEELPLQQPVRKRHLPQPLRLRRPLDGIRVLVSFSH